MPAALIADPQLIRKYGGRGPRYTSYPTADRFVEAYDQDSYRRSLRNRSIGGLARSLALYVHHPFCDTVCYYCACNKIVTRDRGRGEAYFQRLKREAAAVSAILGEDRSVRAMHWGGGTPTFMGTPALARLMETLRREFDLDPQGEYSIEIDPRRVAADTFAELARMGFNRASMGVQDFDADVQKAVNRVQSFEQTRDAVEAARAAGFGSINFDLILGLPRQSVEGFARTLERTVECRPDRVALYGYAHLPQVFKPQRRIAIAELPAPETKLELMVMAIERLQQAGYEHIGMDHFALAHDELSVARRQGRLQRDFQGYSTGDHDTLGLGLSAISSLGAAYSQNCKTLQEYCDAIDAGGLPVARGLELGADELLRRAVIRALACQFLVSKEAFAVGYMIDFDRYFEAELRDLEMLQDDGLVEMDENWIAVTPSGRLLVRSICAVFDLPLRMQGQFERYSRVM